MKNMSMTRQQILKKGYPENLITELGLYAIFGEDSYTPLTEDQLAGLEYAISMLKKREIDLITMRFKGQISFNAIGVIIGRSTERVRQIIKCALRKLRKPNIAGYYISGYNAYTEQINLPLDDLTPVYCSMSDDEIKEALGDRADLSIHELKLPIRVANCLLRTRIDTIYKLVILIYREEDHFRRIRNLGPLSAKDILEACRRHGIEIPECYGDIIS